MDGAITSTIFLLFQLDWLVNDVLYDYGLRSSPEWLSSYWMAIRTSLGLLVLSAVASTLAGTLFYRRMKREMHAGNTVAICKSCGNALTKFGGKLDMEKSTPKFIITKTCPFCNTKLIDK